MAQNGSALSDINSISIGKAKAEHAATRPSSEHVHAPLRIAFRQTAGEPAASSIVALPDSPPPTALRSARIAVKANGRIFLIDPAEILVAEAQGNYVLLQQRNASHLLREQISVLAEKLQPYGLIRIHRSILVNAAHVEDMEPLLTGEYLLRMKGGKEYKVTRTYRCNLQLLADTWIGTCSFAGE
jgi:DNA-binding LytR/AlgR family response regulator